MNKTSQIILYFFTLVIAFVVFVVLLFPLDVVIGHYLAKVEDFTKGEYRISVSEIDASLVFDTQFKKFKVYEKGKEIISIPELDVGFSLFSLLGSKTKISFEAVFDKGSIDGMVGFVTQGSSVSLERLDVDFDTLSLGEIKWLDKYFSSIGPGIEVTGILDGNIALTLESDYRASEANVDLTLSKASIGAIPVNMPQIACEEIGEMSLAEGKQKVVFKMDLNNARITASKISVPGPGLKFDLAGTASLSRKLDVIRMNFDGKVLFSEKSTETCLALRSEEPLNLSIRGPLSKPKVTLAGIPLL